MNWVLFGFKGVGKTTLAQAISLPCIDTDDLIEARAKMSIKDLVHKEGEPMFRRYEKEVIASLSVDGHIISTGAGAVLDSENLHHLQKLGILIYLKQSKEIIRKNLLTPPLPTYLDPYNPEASFEEMYSSRIAKYEKIPSHTIHLSGKTLKQTVEALWQVINLETSSASQPGENLTAEP